MRDIMIVVIEAGDKDNANQDALLFDPSGGQHTFRVGLSPTGTGNPTHYIAVASVTDETLAGVAQLAQTKYPTAHLEVWDWDEEPNRLEEMLDDMSLKRMQEAV